LRDPCDRLPKFRTDARGGVFPVVFFKASVAASAFVQN
jgi:hypothetical protein